MQCPEFRELILYLNNELDEDTLYGRTAIVHEILRYYQKIHDANVKAALTVSSVALFTAFYY